MTSKFHTLVGLVLLMFAALVCQANESAIELAEGAKISLSDRVRFYVDESATRSLDDIRHSTHLSEFTRLREPKLNLGFTDSALWLQFTVCNKTSADDWILKFHYPLLDRIEVYSIDAQGRAQKVILGDRLPFAERAHPSRLLMTSLNLEQDEVAQYFVRIETKSSMQVRLTIERLAAHLSAAAPFEIALGFLYGAVAMMALYNLFLYFAIRESVYLLYVISVLSGGLFALGLHGHTSQYLLPNHPQIANFLNPFSVSLWISATALFARSFLDLPRNAPRLGRALLVLTAFGAVGVGVSLLTDYRTAMQFSSAGAVVSGFGLLAIGALCWWKGDRAARFFTLGWFLFGNGTAILALSRFGLLPDNELTHNAAILGFGLETILLALALSDRFRIEHFQLSEYSQNLEQKVFERTRELEAASRQFEALSLTDSLTGIANRRRFDTYLQEQRGQHARMSLPLSLVLVDVDHFKIYNDHYGHLAGDNCLTEIAKVLDVLAQRAGDLAARYGGEEFAIVLPNTDIEGAVTFAEGVRLAIQSLALPHPDEAQPCVTVSMGVSTALPNQTWSVTQFVAQADAALYESKSQGRNRTTHAQALRLPMDSSVAAAGN